MHRRPGTSTIMCARAGAGSRVYSLDETGELGKFLEENQSSGVSLSAENLADLKKQLSSFCLSYNDQRFESVYDAKYSLQASVAEYMNFNALGDMDAQLQAQGINYKQISTPQPGIISYVTDSFEGVAPEEVTADSFDRSQYTRQVGRGADRGGHAGVQDHHIGELEYRVSDG